MGAIRVPPCPISGRIISYGLGEQSGWQLRFPSAQDGRLGVDSASIQHLRIHRGVFLDHQSTTTSRTHFNGIMGAIWGTPQSISSRTISYGLGEQSGYQLRFPSTQTGRLGVDSVNIKLLRIHRMVFLREFLFPSELNTSGSLTHLFWPGGATN